MSQFAEPFVSFLLENISHLLVEEGKFLNGVSDQAQQLQSKLKLMTSLLKDVDQRQDEDDILREWISQSKDLAYEAENALETYAFRVPARRKGGIINVLKRHSCVLNECCTRHKVATEIQTLNTRVADLTKLFQEFGIRAIMEREGPSFWHRPRLLRRTYSHTEEGDFVGLGSDVRMLVQLLVNENDEIRYRVVSICGMGGLGKTTIARKVYNHPDVRRHFDGFAWICISQQWQTREILTGILLKLIPEKREEIQKWTDDELVGQLYRLQRSKKCLIVLDDIWSTDAWEFIKNGFPQRETGSKILLTTRNKTVALYIGPNGFHHEPRLLNEEESWELLEKKALGEQHSLGFADAHKFEELGTEIVKCCGGLPLAVVVLGGILATKYDTNDWKFVHKNVKSYLGRGDAVGQQEGEVQRILALSYNDLPCQLKPCFLYLGIYPEDSDIETETLYQLWMAEGMVSREDRIGDESMMDTAERYLGELVKRCMIEVKVNDEGPSVRRFESCRLHDLMRDLCLAKGREENFMKVIDYRIGHGDLTEFIDSSSSWSKIRRIVILLGKEDASRYVPLQKQMIMHARSFIMSLVGSENFKGPMKTTQLNNFKKLWVLALNRLGVYTDNFEEEFIDHDSVKLELGNHIHLRYLSLRHSVFTVLPYSLGNLEHLETLDLRVFQVKCIPNVLHRMTRLKHLYLPEYLPDLVKRKLRLCGLTKLELLENFCDTTCEVMDLSELTSLQVLRNTRFRKLSSLEKIIDHISNSNCFKYANFNTFDALEEAEEEKVQRLLEHLFSSNVRHLSIDYSSRIPEYRTQSFEHLIELKLSQSEFVRDPMEMLEKLPRLERLWLKEITFEGNEMSCSSLGFPELRFRSLERLLNPKNWKVKEGSMPNLSRLKISKCYSLVGIPNGFRFIKSLKELVIKDMFPWFTRRIREIDGREGPDFDEVRHVPSVAIIE